MWDERYSEPDYIFGTEPNDFLREQLQTIPAGGHVLCLAEGEGRNAVFLAQQGYQVTAIDSSKVGLDKAKKLADDRGVTITIQVVDLADYVFAAEKWDGIVSIWAHMPKVIRQRVHSHITSALKSGGVFIAEAYTKKQLEMDAIGGPPADQKERFGSLKTFQKELSALKQVVGLETQRMVAEGSRHQGRSAVVQFVGYKA